MNWKTFLLTICLSSLVACGGGGGSGGSSSSTGGNTPTVTGLSKTTIVYKQSPNLNEELTISIEDNTVNVTSDYSWKVESSPSASNLQITAAADSKSVSMTPTIAGTYKISATPATGDALETQFSIVKKLPFSTAKLQGYDATQELSKQTGLVSNQVWIYSETLKQAAIETIASNYSGFNIIEFDEILGLLLEFDETLAQSQVDLDMIRATNGIDGVDLRLFAGRNFLHAPLKVANDGSAFDDGGDNWHLEHIGISKAWDISTGSTETDPFYIGIADSIDLFHTKHEDLNGRFKEATRAIKTEENEDYFDLSWHGTGVAGTIGAISNNKKGMSGINWSNQIVAGMGGYAGLLNISSKDKVLLINNSWSLAGYIDDDFEDDNPLKVENRSKDAYDNTRDIRKLTIAYPEKLFIFAAGNGVANGLGFTGFYGVDARFDSPAIQFTKRKNGDIELAKRPNAVTVSAHLIDNRLAYYSNYGVSVDIAAPAGYKSTKSDNIGIGLPYLSLDEYYKSDEYGTNTSRGSFKGTSSATPIVTGVASLILAVDESFSPSEVKDILINSATEFVTERYIHPGNEDEDYFGPGAVGSGENIESLSHPIPILNAAAALTMAKEIKDARDEATNPNPPSTAAGLLTPITPLTTSETGVLPGNGTIPSISFVEETGTDGDIDQDLFLKQGVTSIQAVDIQRDWGLSVICEDGIHKPVTLNSADYSTSTISDTFYENGQVAVSCSSSFESILPLALTNSNISDVLEDWGSNPLSSDCPITTNITPPPGTSINTSCTSVSLRNYLITDTTGKEHKVSIRLTSDAVE